MKNNLKRIISLLGAVVMLTAALSIPAFAVVSSTDKSTLSTSQQSQIAAATAAYNAAKASGDTAGMAAAHAAAESVRNSAGYSGGTDGSGNTSTSSGSSSSSSSSSSRSSGSSSGSSGSSSTTLSTSQLNSIADQMSANSAAWWVAYYAGDTATMDSLHAANESLASQAAGTGGTSTYNPSDGTYNITTANGTTLTSSSSSNNKQTTVTFETKSSSGVTLNQSATDSYSSDSISSYLNNGGTTDGVATSYNNAAEGVSTTGTYGTDNAANTASAEVAVAQALLGLTDKQAAQLTEDLENSKNDYLSAQDAYNKAIAAGDSTAAAEALADMNAAHAEAEAVRASYGYSGDSSSYEDGGYYDGTTKTAVTASTASSSSFYATTITKTYTITASAGTGGTISPNGSVSVPEGSSKTFTVTPAEGYAVADVKVDGMSIGAVGSYTFSNVTKAHTISASFKVNGKISVEKVGITDAAGVDLSGNSIKSGYGIFANVTASYSNVTSPKMVMTYNFGSGSQSVSLTETRSGTWHFPVNSASKTGQRCIYIPAQTKDGTYTLTLTFTATRADGTTLTETKTATVTVLGSMYEDDFTGNS